MAAASVLLSASPRALATSTPTTPAAAGRETASLWCPNCDLIYISDEFLIVSLIVCKHVAQKCINVHQRAHQVHTLLLLTYSWAALRQPPSCRSLLRTKLVCDITHTHTHTHTVCDIPIAPFPRRTPPAKSFVSVLNKSLIQVVTHMLHGSSATGLGVRLRRATHATRAPSALPPLEGLRLPASLHSRYSRTPGSEGKRSTMRARFGDSACIARCVAARSPKGSAALS